MKLGIVVTDETRCQQALKLAERAVSRGWEIRCFLTDTGVKLLKDPQFLKLIKDDIQNWTSIKNSVFLFLKRLQNEPQ